MRFMPVAIDGAASQPTVVDAHPRPLREETFDERYCVGRPLGVGGMGEVRRCTDQRIGRDVAMKVIRPGHGSCSDLRERFEREARIQGQLDHPSVVPVYDLGVRPDGAAFFTMKRIVGRTLEEVIGALRDGDEDTRASHPRRKLLAAVSSVCLTVAFAHQRGVVHRDLKPANIILGSFGEVYLLDWGVAKLVPEGDTATKAVPIEPSAPTQTEEDRPIGDSAGTAAGTLVGTPGYMAPEQARGDVAAIDARADIYGLGAILFEVLTLQPLHRGQSVNELVARTLAGAEITAEGYGTEPMPPELATICAQATALDPAARFGSARDLHEAIEQYLAGARDLQRRREMAQEHVAAAQEALARGETDPAERPQARTQAMRRLSAALTLNPADHAARTTLMRMIVTSTDDLSPEAEVELSRRQHVARTRTAKIATLALLSLFLLDPIMVHMGVRSWSALAVMGALLVAAAAASYAASRQRRIAPWHFYLFAPLAAALAASCAIFFGPYVIVPGAFVALSLPVIVNLRATRRQRIYFIATGVLALLVPVLLQHLGWLPQSMVFADGAITILPWAVSFPPLTTELYMVACSLMVIATPWSGPSAASSPRPGTCATSCPTRPALPWTQASRSRTIPCGAPLQGDGETDSSSSVPTPSITRS